jgi:hypothetical protein
MSKNDSIHELGDMPIEPEHRRLMVEIAQTLDLAFNGMKRGPERPTGFVLMVFPFGEVLGRCNYISNGADRHDIVALMTEMIARFSSLPDQSGKA